MLIFSSGAAGIFVKHVADFFSDKFFSVVVNRIHILGFCADKQKSQAIRLKQDVLELIFYKTTTLGNGKNLAAAADMKTSIHKYDA